MADKTGIDQLEASANDLLETLPGIANDMISFSKYMASLYNGETPIPNTINGKTLRGLRDEVATQGSIYLHLVMPINRACISKLQAFAELNKYLDFQTWRKNIKVIRDKSGKLYKLFSALLYIHEELMLKQAKHIKEEAVNFKERVEKEERGLEERISETRGPIGAWWLMAVPVVNVVALPFVAAAQRANSNEVDILMEQRDNAAKVNTAVGTKLIPGLDDYIKGLRSITSFFQVMEEELSQCHELSECEEEMHYKILRGKANDMKMGCQKYMAAIPEMKDNLDFVFKAVFDEKEYKKFLEARDEAIKDICDMVDSDELTKLSEKNN